MSTPPCLTLADGNPAPAERWQVDGEFKKGKDLSGIACDPDGLGLVATDEGSLLQSFRLDRAARTLRVADVRAALLREGEEADYEGLGWADGWFYAIGSHARGRNTPDHQASRHHRLPGAAGPGRRIRHEMSHALGALLGADPVLGRHYHRRLDRAERGIDVEGVAVRGDTMLLGLRSPCLDGQAFMLEIALADLFELDRKRPPRFRLHALALGPAAGIRELAAVPGGVLVLSGPSVNGDTAPFALWHWGDDGRLAKLGDVRRAGRRQGRGAAGAGGWRRCARGPGPVRRCRAGSAARISAAVAGVSRCAASHEPLGCRHDDGSVTIA